MSTDVKENLFFFLITCPDITRINKHYTQRNFVIFAKLDFWADPSLNFMLVFHKLCLEFLPPLFTHLLRIKSPCFCVSPASTFPLKTSFKLFMKYNLHFLSSVILLKPIEFVYSFHFVF